MKRCPQCRRTYQSNEAVICSYDGSPLLDTITIHDDQANTLNTDSGYEEVKPRKKHSFKELIIAPLLRVSRTKVHRLLVIWVQLIIANYLVFGIIGELMGAILGISYIILLLPLSIIISRLVNRNIALSIFIGSLVAAMIEGGLGYWVADWAARYGIVYGAFFGASLTLYFSSEDKHTNLLWASTSTLLLIAIIVIPEFARYGVVFILEMIEESIGDSLKGAIMAIVMGLIILPYIKPLKRFIEYVMKKIVDIYGVEY